MVKGFADFELAAMPHRWPGNWSNRKGMEKSYRYLGYFFLLLIPLAFAGFYKTYIVQFPTFENVKYTFIHIHAGIATLWVTLIIAQPFLVVNNKMAWHRRLGKLSYFIFPLLILSFIPSVINNLNSDTPRYAFFAIGDGCLLILFYCLAIRYRRRSPLHMRFMIAAAMVLSGPTIGRILPNIFGFSELATQNVQFAIIQSILIALIIFDIRNGKKYYPYIIAIAGWSVHQLVFYYLSLAWVRMSDLDHMPWQPYLPSSSSSSLKDFSSGNSAIAFL